MHKLAEVAAEHADHFRDAEQRDEDLGTADPGQDAVGTGVVRVRLHTRDVLHRVPEHGDGPLVAQQHRKTASLARRLLENRMSSCCSEGVFVNET